MKIHKLAINGIGGLGSIELKFSREFNLICGPNGVGKTTILECIGHSFAAGSSMLLQRNVKFEEGDFSVSYEHDGEIHSNTLRKKSFHPREQGTEGIAGHYQKARYVVALKTNRTFSYQNLKSLAQDPNKTESVLYAEAARGVGFDDIKNWLAQREMWAPHENGLSIAQKSNLSIAKQCFNYLDDRVSFDKVIPATYDILVKTAQGSIYLEYLSSGFKACICLIIGIIKELEFRFKEPDIDIRNFEGVVTIDELDLHLHPEWQAKLVGILKRVFPSTQFIASTHSPHMIQAAFASEVVPLAFDDSGNVVLRPLTSQLGYQGWTVEEILTDVMGMTDVRSGKYNDLVSHFDSAVENEDFEAAEAAYSVLDGFLHPANELRKLFRFQLAQLATASDD